MTLGSRLRDAIQRRGTSARALGIRLGTSRISIGDYAAGRVSPTAKWLVSAADALEVRAEWLLTGQGDPILGQDIRSQLRRAAPDCIPEAERERFSWLAAAVGHEYGLDGWDQKVKAALRLLTAPLAEVRRGRGERATTPEALLVEQRTFSPGGHRDFVLFSLMALDTLKLPRQRRAEKKQRHKRKKR